MGEILNSTALHAAMADHPHWEVRDGQLVRSIQADSFLDGIKLVDAVAEAAEAANHHPDIDIRWTTITFALVSHDQGGITDVDVQMAAKIDELAAP